MSQRADDHSPRPSSERLPLQDLVDAAWTGIGGQPEQPEGFATRLLSCLRQYGSVDIIVQSMGVLQLVSSACELPPLKEDPEELLAVLHLLHEWAGQLPANQQRPFLRGSWLPLLQLFWHRLHARAAAGPAEAGLQRLQSLADDAQRLLKAAWCTLGSEEAELAAAAAAAAALGQQQQQRQQQQQQQPPSSPTLEGCDALLGVPAGTLASKGFELVNAPLAATFDRSLVSLLFFAAESLELVGQWGRRPMAAFYPNSKAFEDPVWGQFLRRCFRVASLLQWPALGGEAPPRMIEYFINLLWHEAQVKHQDTHTGQRVVEALEAEFTQPGAPRGLAVHLAGSAARLETGTRGRAVLGDTEGLSVGANVDGRKLEHAASSGRRVVSVVTNRNYVQLGSIGSRLLQRASQQAELCGLLSRPPAEIRECILAALPDPIRGVQLDGHGRPVSTRKVPMFDDPSHQPYITREQLLQSISAYEPCRDGPPPRLRQFHNSAASGSVGGAVGGPAVAADQVGPDHIVDPVIRELFLQLRAAGTPHALLTAIGRRGGKRVIDNGGGFRSDAKGNGGHQDPQAMGRRGGKRTIDEGGGFRSDAKGNGGHQDPRAITWRRRGGKRVIDNGGGFRSDAKGNGGHQDPRAITWRRRGGKRAIDNGGGFRSDAKGNGGHQDPQAMNKKRREKYYKDNPSVWMKFVEGDAFDGKVVALIEIAPTARNIKARRINQVVKPGVPQHQDLCFLHRWTKTKPAAGQRLTFTETAEALLKQGITGWMCGAHHM
ncbi:hypothetical protein ABPG77_009043 [Micractinium sp. CCAP 211/92]